MIKLLKRPFGEGTSGAVSSQEVTQSPPASVAIDGTHEFPFAEYVKQVEGFPMVDWEAVDAWVATLPNEVVGTTRSGRILVTAACAHSRRDTVVAGTADVGGVPIDPASEWRLYRQSFDRSVMGDLLDEDCGIAQANTLYRRSRLRATAALVG